MRHAHGNCNAHRNSQSDANSDSYIYLDAHTNRNTYSNSNCDTHCYINADTYTASDPMREMFTHAEAPPNSSAATVAILQYREASPSTDSNSRNAVSISSARTTKRFPSSRCASAKKSLDISDALAVKGLLVNRSAAK
jgi:hypothetical protein